MPRIALAVAMALPLLAVGPAASIGLPAQQAELPRVLVITTGGTIAGGPDGQRYDGQDFLRAVPQIAEVAEAEVEEFSSIGSSKMTPPHWLGLSQRINSIFRSREDLAGIVVTHGTDSLEETAYFLSLTVRDPRPVVVVGAMRNWRAIAPDGPANLYNAVRVAVHPDAVGKGSLIVMNDEISSARDALKMDALRVNTFRNANRGFLGVTDQDAVLFYHQPLHRHTVDSEFDVMGLDELPEVALVSDYTGASGAEILEAEARGVDGIVVISFPTGLLSDGSTRASLEVSERGLPVVRASRSAFGRVGDMYSVGSADQPRPGAARDLPGHKARILLMLALTRTQDMKEIQRIFDSY